MQHRFQSQRLRLTISTQLTLWYGLTLLIVLSLYALFAFTSFRQGLERDFDYHLERETADLIAFIDLAGATPSFVGLDDLQSVAYQTDGYYGTYVRLFSPSGGELYRSPNFKGHAPLPIQIPARVGIVGVTRIWEEQPVRSEYVPLIGSEAEVKGWLEVTAVEWTLYRDLNRFAWELTVGGALILLFALSGGYWLAHRALSPMAALNRAAQNIQASSLSARLPIDSGIHDEVTDIAETFNDLLERLATSFTAERRFTANAAHELLTPLTTMRGEADLSLRRDRSADHYRQTLKTLLSDTDRMIEIVHHLLQLSHAENLDMTAAETVNLSHVAESVVQRFQLRATDKHLHLDADIEPDVWVMAHEARLAEVFNNLLDNALKYTPQGGNIVLRVRAQENFARIAVLDDGIGFDAHIHKHLFHRFYRAKDPLVTASYGSGLGLSIVEKIADAYGGTVGAESSGPQQGSTFTVLLPRL